MWSVLIGHLSYHQVQPYSSIFLLATTAHRSGICCSLACLSSLRKLKAGGIQHPVHAVLDWST